MSHVQQAVDEPQINEYMLLVALASHKKWPEYINYSVCLAFLKEVFTT